jgi:NAD(P)-dependent dehydrogenase (short-subunit alcohol dehydrogenase family)
MTAANLVDFKNIFSLEGKVAVITGSSKGLGLATASGMLQAGASKVYITSRTVTACAEACAELNKLPNLRPGSEAISVPGDSSTVEGIQQIVDAVNKTTSHIDILVANAGGTAAASIETTDEREFSNVLDLNLKGVFFLIQRYPDSACIFRQES